MKRIYFCTIEILLYSTKLSMIEACTQIPYPYLLPIYNQKYRIIKKCSFYFYLNN